MAAVATMTSGGSLGMSMGVVDLTPQASALAQVFLGAHKGKGKHKHKKKYKHGQKHWEDSEPNMAPALSHTDSDSGTASDADSLSDNYSDAESDGGVAVGAGTDSATAAAPLYVPPSLDMPLALAPLGVTDVGADPLSDGDADEGYGEPAQVQTADAALKRLEDLWAEKRAQQAQAPLLGRTWTILRP